MTTKNKLYIDAQFFQTPAWDRGMGRYTMSLLGKLQAIATDLDFVFIFSGNLPQNVAMKKNVQAAIPRAEFVTLDLATTKKVSYADASRHNKDILNDFLAGHTPDTARRIFMLPCLFQEPTASVFPDGVEKSLLYYDAIPLLYFHRYLGAIDYRNYLQRHTALFEADKIFTISQTIADDLAIYYGMKTDSQRVFNIDGACIEGMFEVFKKPKLELPSKYILFPTSDDIRKNNHMAVQAFDQLRTLTGVDYRLVVTSKFDKSRREALEKLSKNLIFTGNVSDAELAWLYKHAEVVLFTSEYEGLGLPVLEAVRMGKKVVCSSIPVFREISEDAFYFFDPLDSSDITHKLYKALQGDSWSDKKALYSSINQRYTWERTAQIVHNTLQDAPVVRAQAVRPKIAILCPTPDGYSAIGKVVQELHEVTARYLDVHYYFETRKEKDPLQIRPNYLEYLAPCFEVEDFNAAAYRQYDAVIYHIGNSEYHFRTILNALHLPGIAIFHDTILREAFGEMVRLGFMQESRLHAEAKLDELVGAEKTGFMTSIANNQLAAITHSDYAQQAIRHLVGKDVAVHRSELPVAYPSQSVQSQSRDKVHIGLGGIMSGLKGLEIVKELALDEMLAEKAVLHVFGFNFVDPDAARQIEPYKNVRLANNLSDLEYQMQLGNLDILVNYRRQYRGETSLTVLEAMRYGCATIVNGKMGWFGELPDDTVVKVNDPAKLINTIRELVDSAEKRHAVGAAAKAYIKNKHDPELYIQHLAHLVANPGDSANAKRAQIIRTHDSVKDILQQFKHGE